MVGRLRRAAVAALAGFGLVVGGVLALAIGANTLAALWNERWQLLFAAGTLAMLVVVAWLRRRL